MATIKPFCSIRPRKDIAHKVAALPYDVYNREEAKEEVKKEALSFLNIDRAEVQLDDNVSTYDEVVYSKAKETLNKMIDDGIFVTEEKECFYIYELGMNGNIQTGIVACSSIDDYLNNIIKKHENTREDKEIDRIRHVDICNAQTGPIFLAYKSNPTISKILDDTKKEEPLYDFTAVDNVNHFVWKIDNDETIDLIRKIFANIDSVYIADGHHRAASAVKVGLKRREGGNYTGEEEFNYFLSVLFPHDQLNIMSYNRAVYDLHNLTKDEFLSEINKSFEVEVNGKDMYDPKEKLNFGMYLDNQWYRLKIKDVISSKITDYVEKLDVSILQDYLLKPILGINDPRTDKRIEFIGGIRGLTELEDRVNDGMAVAFSLYPTSIIELFSVSDAGKLMPPKSTWFEPKLRSGLFVHKL